MTSKRQRVTGNFSGNLNSLQNINESQIQNILDRVVNDTEDWPSQHLEALYASLELTIEKKYDDKFTSIIDCIENFHKYKDFHNNSVFKNNNE